MKGQLTLIPTPIDDTSPLCVVAKSLLEQAVQNNDLIYVEEAKEGRRRWLRFGLPRQAIDHFVIYNEHTRDELCRESIQKLKSGKNIFLMSDCGLPAFCDPGVELVSACHSAGVKVTSTPFANSIALAVALSGISHDRFVFEGFIPAKKEDRKREINRLAKDKTVTILMDTPYRLNKLIDELNAVCPNRIAFLGLELNKEDESLIKGTISYIKSRINNEKKEFILILG